MYPYAVIFGMGFYEIFLIIAMLSALFVADRLGIRRGFSVKLQKLVIVAAVVAIAFGLLGAALFQAFYDWIKTGVFKAFDAGVTFYGGFIFGVASFLGVWFGGAKLLKIGDEARKRFADMADIAACVVPMGHGFGRIGCFFAGCCYGMPTDAWYGVTMNGQKVVPLQLFEAIFLFALSLAMYCLFFFRTEKKRVPLLPIYGAVYGVWRFFIEFFRDDDRGMTVVEWLTPSQLVAILLVIGSIVYFIIWYTAKKKAKQNTTPNT